MGCFTPQRTINLTSSVSENDTSDITPEKTPTATKNPPVSEVCLINPAIPKPVGNQQPRRVAYYGEFGFDLVTVLPHVYWLHLNGLLLGTQGPKGSAELYSSFTPKHIVDSAPRDGYKNAEDGGATGWARNPGWCPRYDISEWSPPPLRAQYKNLLDFSFFTKPLFVILNKYHVEWWETPINALPIAGLDALIWLLQQTYQIVYINGNTIRPTEMSGQEFATESYDFQDSPHLSLNDYRRCEDLLVKKYPSVVRLQDLLRRFPNNTYNEVQLAVLANAERFLSVQGGPAVIASYWGGVNFVFSQDSGPGGEDDTHSYTTLFPMLSSAVVIPGKFPFLVETILQFVEQDRRQAHEAANCSAPFQPRYLHFSDFLNGAPGGKKLGETCTYKVADKFHGPNLQPVANL
eukprot:TRINITY_DN1401_c0_g1_i1.p1 TRINITY_DN1401_c0_g1~~TRINITY_DN1401_c0_g1_i1.p1  ORF type:complete len:459 (-),score=28.99 TRINITY_DN1401_c0_g1_i1:293-1507(-)